MKRPDHLGRRAAAIIAAAVLLGRLRRGGQERLDVGHERRIEWRLERVRQHGGHEHGHHEHWVKRVRKHAGHEQGRELGGGGHAVGGRDQAGADADAWDRGVAGDEDHGQAMTAVPFVIYNGTSEQMVKPDRRRAFT